MNYGLATVNSTSEAIKQINYRNSDKLFKLASQRLMAFVDASTPEGAQTIYKGEIPDDILDPVFKDRTKKDFLYTRLDIYFYDNENYVNPPNITEKHVFSIDKLKQYIPRSDGCVEKRGEAVADFEKGYFTNFEEDKKNIILKENIYSNELFNYCDLTVIDPTKEGEIKKYFGDTDDYKLVHYIIPNVEENITRPGQLYNFTEKTIYSGYHNIYPSIKFIYVHSLTYILNSQYCLYGGRIIIDIRPKLEINSIDDITVSPDQIAVYKTEYNEQKIYIYFKRGLMSNEQFGKNVTIIINIENLNSNNNETFDFTLEEMKFDISNPPDYERYTKIADASGKKEFKYISVFSYPALQIKTKLNRTLNRYETIEPFSRYGVYTQEIFHRTVYSYPETHLQTDPGVVGKGEDFSLISNLGTSSIPLLNI